MENRVYSKKFGKLHYLVKLDDGYTLKRHIDQLRSSKVQQKKSSLHQTRLKIKMGQTTSKLNTIKLFASTFTSLHTSNSQKMQTSPPKKSHPHLHVTNINSQK